VSTSIYTKADKAPVTAADWEVRGFNHVLEKDISQALEAFTQAEKLWPDYHNVSEIRRLLIQKQDALKVKDSAQWKEVYQKILSQYSWGMPSDVSARIQNQI
jgi:hypothetical protein